MDEPKDQVLVDIPDYCAAAFHDMEGIVRQAKVALADVDFDTFVGVGVSGILPAMKLAESMGKFFAAIRDSRHHGRLAGRVGRRWVFVDDLISSGDTYRKAKEVVASKAAAAEYFAGTEHVGYILYGTANAANVLYYPAKTRKEGDSNGGTEQVPTAE